MIPYNHPSPSAKEKVVYVERAHKQIENDLFEKLEQTQYLSQAIQKAKDRNSTFVKVWGDLHLDVTKDLTEKGYHVIRMPCAAAAPSTVTYVEFEKGASGTHHNPRF